MSKSKEYKYQLLDRLKQDCEYYLGYGGKNPRVLWAGDEKEQINKMLELYNSFKDSEKPEWLSLDDIKNYAKKLNVPLEEELGNENYNFLDDEDKKFKSYLKIFKEELEDTREYIKDYSDEDENLITLQEVGEKYSKPLANIMFELGYSGWHFEDLNNLEGMVEQMVHTIKENGTEDEYDEEKIINDIYKILEDITVLKQEGNTRLLKYNLAKTTYSVDNKDLVTSIYFGLDLEKAKNIYQKEVILESLQKQDNNILCQISDLSSIVSDGKSKVFVFDDCIYGRRDDIIDYLREEIEQMNNNPAFFDDEQEQEADIKEGIYETLVELEEGKESLDPLYLFVHPQDEHLHLANDNEQLEKYEEFFDKVSEIILENEESEEDEL